LALVGVSVTASKVFASGHGDGQRQRQAAFQIHGADFERRGHVARFGVLEQEAGLFTFTFGNYFDFVLQTVAKARRPTHQQDHRSHQRFQTST
jgi:hypothetical protein